MSNVVIITLLICSSFPYWSDDSGTGFDAFYPDPQRQERAGRVMSNIAIVLI